MNSSDWTDQEVCMDGSDWTDQEVWDAQLSLSSSTWLICRKMRLVGKASRILHKRIRHINRRISRLNKRIVKLMEDEWTLTNIRSTL